MVNNVDYTQQGAGNPLPEKVRGDHKMITILLILLVFGWLGFHRLYLGHLKSGFAQLIGVIVGWALIFVGLGTAPTNAMGEAELAGGSLGLFVLGFLLLLGVGLSVFIDFIFILIDKMTDSKGLYIQR
ncbi:MAG: TM2 domain-containing protein [Candidatus Spechtbacteria bacterium SB0662_bin_43]|uniref:TM2 domain-containing protein n=1 Tax=Candidatus Spechtbacteria bacterium SB0662_bin_43 TaxID=2604897 RepID=A0A845D9L1_9BACT|nr:TM2 domain-containing protein [Candidatus Spechtbacteria bacterium SB0662_bin_43]